VCVSLIGRRLVVCVQFDGSCLTRVRPSAVHRSIACACRLLDAVLSRLRNVCWPRVNVRVSFVRRFVCRRIPICVCSCVPDRRRPWCGIVRHWSDTIELVHRVSESKYNTPDTWFIHPFVISTLIIFINVFIYSFDIYVSVTEFPYC